MDVEWSDHAALTLDDGTTVALFQECRRALRKIYSADDIRIAVFSSDFLNAYPYDEDTLTSDGEAFLDAQVPGAIVRYSE